MATGHYVRRQVGARGPELHRGADPARDQSYFLFATTREQLNYLRFPLGALPKAAVREAAAALGLAVADKPDSQDICFVPEGKYSTLIDKLRPDAAGEGDIVHLDGRRLGTHPGVSRYTVGQRRGLNVAVGEPLFVVAIDPARKRVVVGPREALLTRALDMKETNWLGDEGTLEAAAAAGLAVSVRVRSTRDPVPARLRLREGGPGLVFNAPEEGVSPGQACVLYSAADPSRSLGGGFIAATERAVSAGSARSMLLAPAD